MTTGNPRYGRLPVLNINRIIFSLLSHDEINRMVVCNVIHKEVNTAQRAGDANTLYDRRMGPINEIDPCKTCGQKLRTCHGHFGRIQFALPMVHPEYGKDYANLLSGFCNCLVPDEDYPGHKRLCLAPLFTSQTVDRYANLPPEQRWRRTATAPGKSCALYGNAHKKQATVVYYTDKDPHGGTSPFRIILRRTDEPEMVLNPARLQKWVATHVPAHALADLGLERLSANRAEQMVMNSLLVLPNTMRLPTTGEGTQNTIHHDLTQIYSKVIAANNELQAKIAEEGETYVGLDPADPRMDRFFVEKAKSEPYVKLCTTTHHFYNNKDNACRDMHATKAPKGVREFLDPKEGFFRQEILAGRSNNTARTVAVASPDIDAEEAGIPEEIMNRLVTEVEVTEYNVEDVKALARAGKVKAIKGGPERERRGGVCIDVASAIAVPEEIQKLRAVIAEYVNEHEEEPGNTYLRTALDVSQEKLDELLRIHQELEEETQTRSSRIASCIESIAPGDKIERSLQDGDIVIMSRQPILRKESVMAHRAVSVPGKAIMIADGVNQPYNLDHDGDEMNIYVPQGIEAQAQATKLMLINRNLLSAQTNKPVIGLIQDALLSAMLMTSTVVVATETTEKVVVGGVEMTRPKVIRQTIDVEANMKLTVWNDCVATVKLEHRIPSLIARCKRVGINPYSGRGLFSILFREDFRHEGRSPDKKTPLRIEGGILISGTLSQASLNTAQNSIHHELALRYGPDEAVRFLSDARRLCHKWLESYGYTLGYKDFAQSRVAQADIERVKNELIDGVKRTARAGQGAKGSLAAHIEADVLRGSNNIMDQLSGIVARHLNTHNNAFLQMVTAGSKGSITSITQMLGIVGQITIRQERPALTLSDRRRVDLHYTEDDPSPEARGLCSSSYVRGLGPSALIFQGMATHQAAFDIAHHTGDTGYIQRKLVMFLNFLLSKQNGSVISSDGSIVQFRYGGDGLSGHRVVNVGGKARFVNIDSVVDAVKLEAALARIKGVSLPPATRHFLTTFEEVAVVTKRALALRRGAKPYIKQKPGMPISDVLMANAELEEGLIPEVTVQRRLASGQNGEVLLERAIGSEMTIKDGV